MANHPAHILDSKGKYSPSSFIPFCSFGTKPLGVKDDGFDIPVCDIFNPIIHNDQLCYETDLEPLRSYNTRVAIEQLKIGLVLILDYNDDRQLEPVLGTKSSVMEDQLYFDHNDGNPSIMYFDTISKIKQSEKLIYKDFYFRPSVLIWRGAVQS